MTLWPATVELGGVSIPLDEVLADVTIHTGRADVAAEPTASTCQVTFHDVGRPFVASFDIGQVLKVTVADGTAPAVPRFTGKVTDARLDVDELTVIATGALSTLRLFTVGEVNWPFESWSARVTRLFAEAGLSSSLVLQADPAFDPELSQRDPATAGPTTLGDYLAFLAPMVGAAIVDLPDGRILVQALGARTLASELELDPADVAYAPAWLEQLPLGNIVTVQYSADQSQSVTATDSASVARYGKRPATIATSFRYAADATARANQYLSRAAFTHWNITDAPILRGLSLSLGQPLVLTDMPPASPFSVWTPILEGWTDTISRDLWNMELALSDPLLSGLTLPWGAVPLELAYRWSTVDVATDWTEALTLEALHAG